MDPPNLPSTPGTGLCLCGAAYYFERGTEAGDHGHFHCLRCGRRYAFWTGWEPGRGARAERHEAEDEGEAGRRGGP